MSEEKIIKSFTPSDFITLCENHRRISDHNEHQTNIAFWNDSYTSSYREGTRVLIKHLRAQTYPEHDLIKIYYDDFHLFTVRSNKDIVYVYDRQHDQEVPFDDASVIAQSAMFLYCEKVCKIIRSINKDRDYLLVHIRKSNLISCINKGEVSKYI